MAACSAQIGSISVTITRAPWPLSDCGAALADVAVAADDGDLAADHDVGGAVDAVDQRVAAAVEVVELGLGDRVVDVDGREQQRAGLEHLVEAVHAGGGLLGDAVDALARPRSSGWAPWRRTLVSSVEDDAPLLGVVLGGVAAPTPAASNSRALVDEQRGVAAVVEDHVGAGAVGPAQRLLGAPPVLLERLALPGEDRDALRVRRWCRWGRRRWPRRRGPGCEKMLQLTQRTSAPRAVSVSMSTAVWMVMCSEPMMRGAGQGLGCRRTRRGGP